jgi:hypothetical protein
MRFPSRASHSLAVLFALLPNALSAQAQPSSPAADPLAARMDAIFAAYDKPGVPGCAAGVYRDGKIAFSKGYGAANLEHGIVPVRVEVRFEPAGAADPSGWSSRRRARIRASSPPSRPPAETSEALNAYAGTYASGELALPGRSPSATAGSSPPGTERAR